MKRIFVLLSVVVLCSTSCAPSTQTTIDDKPFPGFVQIERKGPGSNFFVDPKSIRRQASGVYLFRFLQELSSGYSIQDAQFDAEDHFISQEGLEYKTDGTVRGKFTGISSTIDEKLQPGLVAVMRFVREQPVTQTQPVDASLPRQEKQRDSPAAPIPTSAKPPNATSEVTRKIVVPKDRFSATQSTLAKQTVSELIKSMETRNPHFLEVRDELQQRAESMQAEDLQTLITKVSIRSEAYGVISTEMRKRGSDPLAMMSAESLLKQLKDSPWRSHGYTNAFREFIRSARNISSDNLRSVANTEKPGSGFYNVAAMELRRREAKE